MKQWTYYRPHRPECLSMHDCKVTRMEYESLEKGGRLIWYFDDGIWITPEDPLHPIDQICRTSEACVVFEGTYVAEDEWMVSLCIKSKQHGKHKSKRTETWQEMTLGEFMTFFQKRKATLEVIGTYSECGNYLITGEVHIPGRRHWMRDIRFSIVVESVSCGWNEFRTDRVW